MLFWRQETKQLTKDKENTQGRGVKKHEERLHQSNEHELEVNHQLCFLSLFHFNHEKNHIISKHLVLCNLESKQACKFWSHIIFLLFSWFLKALLRLSWSLFLECKKAESVFCLTSLQIHLSLSHAMKNEKRKKGERKSASNPGGTQTKFSSGGEETRLEKSLRRRGEERNPLVHTGCYNTRLAPLLISCYTRLIEEINQNVLVPLHRSMQLKFRESHSFSPVSIFLYQQYILQNTFMWAKCVSSFFSPLLF